MSSSSDNKKRKAEAFSSVLFSVPEPKKLKAIEEVKRWNVAQVLEVLQKEVGLDDDDLKQINGLKGGYLIAAIKAYKREISSNETPNTAYQKIISFLMTIERVVTGIYVAESITNWLIEHFIDSESITEIQYKPDDYGYEETDGDEINRKYIYKSQFQQEELLFLQELEQYNLKDLSTPFSKTLDPLSFKLQHREQTIEEIVKVGSKHLEVYPLANKGKQQINFFIAKGGSGSGKTRILTEIPNIFRGHSGQELDTIFENTKIIYFNFANGFSLDSTDRDKRSISMIVSRIVYAAFKRPNELAQKTPPSENDLFLYEVLRIISKKLHATYGETVIPLVLAFDEYQLATRANPGLHTSIQHKLGWYIRQIQNRQQILLFPAFGGTFVESDVKMEPTQYTPAPLALPSLRPIDIEAIMNDMGLSELYTGNYREFWNAIGIVPRHLEWALGNDGKQLKSLVLNDETVRTIIYANVVNIVKKQYHNNLYDDYFGELALKTISGLKYNKDQRLNEYISEGKIYDDGFIGIPLVVIDILATKMEYIPKCVVSDFITASNKPLWEKFEELCIKTMTARFNVLYTINRSEKVQFSELFKGAHFKTDLGYMSLNTTNSSWFKYECLETFLSSNNKEEENEGIISPVCLKKAKQNQDDVDGVLCTLRNVSTNEQILFVTQNKFQYEDSESRTLEPADLIKFYEKAVRTTFKESKTFVIIFTNKTITKKTQEMVIEGLVSKKTKKGPQQKVTVDTEKLILVSGDCFCNFFHPYISNVLANERKSKKDKNKCKQEELTIL